MPSNTSPIYSGVGQIGFTTVVSDNSLCSGEDAQIQLNSSVAGITYSTLVNASAGVSGASNVNGALIDQTVTNAPSTSAVLIDRFATSSYSSAKYMVQSKQGTTSNVQVMEALVVHDSTTAYVVTYGIINTGNAMGTLTANITSGNVNLYFTATSGTVNSNVKVQTTYIV